MAKVRRTTRLVLASLPVGMICLFFLYADWHNAHLSPGIAYVIHGVFGGGAVLCAFIQLYSLLPGLALLLRPSFRRHAGALIVCPVVFCFLLLRAERFNGLNAEKAGLDVDA